MYYIYIVYSKKLDKIYKGCTKSIRDRVDEHNNGKVKSTKSGIPWRLIYYEAFLSKTDARREELFLKSGKGRERLKYLLRNSLK